MRNRAALFVTLSLLALTAVPASAGAGVTIDPVKTTAKSEYLPAPGSSSNHDYFAWSQRVNGFSHVFLEVDGGAKSQVDTGVHGFAGAFAPGEDRLLYQRITFPGGNAQSDLRFYNGDTGGTSNLPAAINNDQWQWAPAYDLDGSDNVWVLYGENRFNRPTAPWRVMLFDGSTSTKQVLAETTNRCGCIFPGTFAYPWISWSKGLDGNVWRMNVVTEEKEKLSVPGNRDEHAIGVTADGTAYVVQDGGRCGSHSRVYRVDPDGTATMIASMPDGTEPSTLAPFDTGAGIDVYFDRYACSTGKANIYVIRNADTVARTTTATLVGEGSSRAGARPAGSVPPSR